MTGKGMSFANLKKIMGLALIAALSLGTPFYAGGRFTDTSVSASGTTGNMDTGTGTGDTTEVPSRRILFATDDPSIIRDTDTITSSYGDVYLVQYGSTKEAGEAYQYYSAHADFADYDTGIAAAEGTGGTPSSTGTVMTAKENPLAELSAQVKDDKKQGDTVGAGKDGHPLVALVDSGAPKNDSHIVDAVSMIGDDPYDDNGHGTDMAGEIEGQDPDAEILSIKVLDEDGKGDISAVYAGIRYAVRQKADIINISMSAVSTGQNAILAEAVKAAAKTGITVVASAGNNGKNVKYYTPGNIPEAVIIGACGENGSRLENSNYGNTVDYNVAAGSTSAAAAKFSGIIASLMAEKKDWKEAITVNNGTLIFTPDDSNQGEDNPTGTEGDDGKTFGADADIPSITVATHFGFEGWTTMYAVNNAGWVHHYYNTQESSAYLQAISFQLNKGGLSALSGGVQYRGHVAGGDYQNAAGHTVRAGGWEGWKTGFDNWAWTYGQDEGNYAGTIGASRSLEALQLYLTGDFANLFDVVYSLHGYNNCQAVVWPNTYYTCGRKGGDWDNGIDAYNGQTAGKEGVSRRNHDVYVRLNPHYYTLSFNANGGSGGQGSLSVGAGLTQNNGQVSTPSRTGYTFLGYYTEASGGHQVYQAGGWRNNDNYLWYNDLWGHAGDVTLYAHWQANNYTVTYNKNGSTDSNTMPDSTATYDTNFVTRKNVFSKTGYDFDGWNEKADGSGTPWTLMSTGVYENGDGANPWKWTYPYNITLYAQWRYHVQFDGNAPKDVEGNTLEVAGSVASMDSLYSGHSYALNQNQFSVYGYEFLGWSTDKNDTSPQYTDGGAISGNPTPNNGSTVTLYAIWKISSYPVTYRLQKDNDAEIDMPATVSLANKKTVVYPAHGGLYFENPRMTNARFTGWTCAELGVTDKTKDLTVSSDQVKVWYGAKTDKADNVGLTMVAHFETVPPFEFVDEKTGETPILNETEKNQGKFRIEEIESSPGYIYEDQYHDIDIRDKDDTHEYQDNDYRNLTFPEKNGK